MISKRMTFYNTGEQFLAPQDRKMKRNTFLNRKQAQQRMRYLQCKISNANFLEQNKEEYLREYQHLCELLSGNFSHAKHSTNQACYTRYSLGYGIQGGMIDQRMENYHNPSSQEISSLRSINSDVLSAPLPEQIISNFQPLMNHQIPKLKDPEPFSKPIKKDVRQNEKKEPEKDSIEELVSMIQQGMEASVKTQSKDVVFLIGKTGSGKSTLIHFVAGVQIKDVAEMDVQENCVHVPNLSFSNQLDGFKAKKSASAQTKVINVFQTQKLSFVDSAGLSDPTVQNFNLANTVSLERALHNAKTVRLILLIQQQTIFGDERGASLIKLLTEITGYVNSLPIEKFIPTVTVIVSHCNVSSSEYVKQFMRILVAEQRQPIIRNPTQREKVIKFLQAMISGAQFEAKKNEIKKIEVEAKRIKEKIQQNEEKIKQADILRLKKKIQEQNQQIRGYERKVNKMGLDEEVSESIRNQKILAWMQQIKELQNSVQRNQQKITQREEQLQDTLREIQLDKTKLAQKRQLIKVYKSSYEFELIKAKQAKIFFNELLFYPAAKLTSNDERIYLIDSLQKCPSVNQTKENFKISIHNSLRTNTQNMVSKIILTIHSLLQQYKYKIAQQRLDEILYLNQFINFSVFSRSRDNCCRIIKDSIEKNCKNFKKILDDAISQKGQLANEGVYSLVQCLRNMDETMTLIQKIPNFDTNEFSLEGLYSYLIKRYQLIVDYVLVALKTATEENLFKAGYAIEKLQKLYSKFACEIPKIRELYQTFALNMSAIFVSRVDQAKECIQRGDYYSLTVNLTFFKSFKKTIIGRFDLNVEKVYQVLIEQTLSSLQYRCECGFEKIIESLTCEKVKKLQEEFMSLSALAKQTELMGHIGRQNFEKFTFLVSQLIISHSNKLIVQIKGLIAKNSFEELKDPMSLLYDIRKIDDSIAGKTAEEYAKFISRLENDLTDRSNQVIREVMRKVKSGAVTDDQINELKNVLNKLQKMTWLEAVLGSEGIKQMLENTMKQLTGQVTSILQRIKHIFSNKFDRCEDEEIPNSDDSINEQFSQSERAICLLNQIRGQRFRVLNSQIRFCKKLSQINENLKLCFIKLEEEITTVIDSECSKVDNLINLNLDTRTLHKIQLERQIIRLNSIKDIKLQFAYKIERILQKIGQKLVDYYEKNNESIRQAQIGNDDTIKKCVTTCVKLFQSLRICDHLLRKRKINNQDYKDALLQMLKEKFYEYFQSIGEKIKNHKFNDVRCLLQTLKKYRTSDVNIFLSNQLKEKYEKLFEDYNKEILQIPANIDNLFKYGQFSELLIVFEEYKQNVNDKDCRNIQNKIINIIEMKSQSILDDIPGLSSADIATFQPLNSSIKKFNQYKEIQSIVPTMKYSQKRSAITSAIQKVYQKMVDEAKKNIKKLNFKNIKIKIDRIDAFHNTLLKNISDLDYKIQQFNIKAEMEDFVETVQKEDLKNQWKKYFNYVDKLKIIDEQYDGDENRSEYVKKLKKHLNEQFSSIQNQIKSAKIEELDKYQIQLKTLKSQTFEYLSNNKDFIEFVDGFIKIQILIQDYVDLESNDSKYRPDMLKKLKQNNNSTSYTKAVKQIKSEYQTLVTKIEEAKKANSYSNLSDAMVQIQKFKQLKDHINFPQGKKPTEVQASTKTHIARKCLSLKNYISYQLSSKKVENLVDFSKLKQYLQILLNMKLTDDIIQDGKTIHNEILQCVEKIIPKLKMHSTINEQNHRLQTIKRYEAFVDILKKYVNAIYNSNKIESFVFCDYSQFAKLICSVQSATEYQTKLCSSIRELPLLVEQYFESGQFKRVSEAIIDVKNTNTIESTHAFTGISELVRKLIDNLGTVVTSKVEERNFEGVNDIINKIGKAEEQFQNIKGLVPPKSVLQKVLTHLDQIIRTKHVNVAKQKVGGKEAEQAIKEIIAIMEWVNNLPVLQKIAHNHIDEILGQAQKKKTIGRLLGQLQKKKQNNATMTICNQIIHAHRQKLKIQRIMPKMTMSIEDCIAQFKGERQDSIDKEILLNIYCIYLDQYESLKERYISKSYREEIAENLLAIKQIAFEALQIIRSSNNFNEDSRTNIPVLLARLFIYMSIMKSADSFYNALKSEERSQYASDYLLQPHPIQVLSILRFIGCDSKTSFLEKISFGLISLGKLENHLMQIKTGQGKSIILGAMSLLLSLMGNEVYCVCYSAYLSDRDFLYFKDMFEAFDVIDKVKYGTFSEISEIIINEQGDVRTLVSNSFSTVKKSNHFSKKSKCKGSRFLLVDQVDTFLSKEFYGNTYNPCTLLSNPNVVEIIKFIWAHRNDNASQIETLMRATPHYTNACNDYKDCMQKIDGQLKIMVCDVKNFKSRDYVCQNGKIGYKELDGVSFKTVYGYETMFLHMYEHGLGNVNEETLKENLGITLSCGNFSYAEIVDGFDKIFGVSGTLQNLNEYEQNILKRYKITLKTYTPSVYGSSRRIQKPILIEEGQGRHYQTIASTILEGIKNKGAILVFFENEVELERFKNSSYTEHFKKNMSVVTEKTYDRDFLIKKATSSELVTFFTAPFGRGTDFLVFDDLVKQRGIDVIQTFLSEQLSEEIQVKGRTARQGAKGTYQLILEFGQLVQKYKVTKDMISKAKQNDGEDLLSKMLQRKRQDYCNVRYSERQKTLQKSKVAHTESVAKRNLILDKKISRDDKFFFKTISGSAGKARICIAIDSTCSMGGTIAAVKDKVMKMIEKLSKDYPNMFEIQIMFYYGEDSYSTTRNSQSWGSTNKLHVSPWSSDVRILNDFLKSAGASGGSGHEAIEVALHHLVKCNEQVGMNKAILIGDAGLEGRLDSSLAYQVHPQNASRYPPRVASRPMTLVLSSLLSELSSRGVQVDTYAIGNSQQIQVTGKQISDATKGTMTPFDPNKDDLATKIESVITECIKMKK